MKPAVRAIAIAVAVAVAVAMVTALPLTSGCNNAPPTSAKNVAASAARDLLAGSGDVVVLDVRTPQEYARGHIKGAINLSVAAHDFATSVGKLDHSATYLVHCAVNPRGGRADRALGTLERQGFDKLVNLQGGFNAWHAAGYPFVKGPATGAPTP